MYKRQLQYHVRPKAGTIIDIAFACLLCTIGFVLDGSGSHHSHFLALDFCVSGDIHHACHFDLFSISGDKDFSLSTIDGIFC